MHTGTKESIFQFARTAKLFSLSRKITARKLRILCYHGIWLGPDHWGDFLFMSQGRFAERLELIQSLGFHVISLDDAIAALDEGALPEDAVVITIDDGWYGTYKHMFPALKEAGMPFTIYAYTEPMLENAPVFNVLIRYIVTVGKPVTLNLVDIFDDIDVDNDSYNLDDLASRSEAITRIAGLFNANVKSNTWERHLRRLGRIIKVDIEPLLKERVFHLMTPEELSEVPSFGGTIELHTHTHNLEFDDPDQVRRTIEDNRTHLERMVNGTYQNFCYPSGYHRSDVYAILTNLGIKTATTTDPGFVDTSTHRLTMPRICDGESISQIAFEAELCGALEIKRLLSGLVPIRKRA